MKEITAYRCSHCGKVYVTKKACIVHENNCIRNRENRCCPTCVWDGWHECGAGNRPEGVAMLRNCIHWKDIDDIEDMLEANQ